MDNLNFATIAKDLSKCPHLKDLVMPDVDDEQVTMLTGANVPEAQAHEECRRGGITRTVCCSHCAGLVCALIS